MIMYKLEDADMAQNLQVGPKLGNIKKVLFLLFILLFILLYYYCKNTCWTPYIAMQIVLEDRIYCTIIV